MKTDFLKLKKISEKIIFDKEIKKFIIVYFLKILVFLIQNKTIHRIKASNIN